MCAFNLAVIEREARSYENFLSKLTVDENGCWNCSGFKDKDGYAQFHRLRKTRKAHRVSYEFHKGVIPPELTIDHLCRNKACCNPDHLEAVTREENIRRAGAEGVKNWFKQLGKAETARIMREKSALAAQLKKAKTHCQRGHEWKSETTYTNPRGDRRCQICFYNTPSMRNRNKTEV